MSLEVGLYVNFQCVRNRKVLESQHLESPGAGKSGTVDMALDSELLAPAALKMNSFLSAYLLFLLFTPLG